MIYLLVCLFNKELTYRMKLPADAWVVYHIETLEKNMETVLLAVAQGYFVITIYNSDDVFC
jgi:hypothetical protein